MRRSQVSRVVVALGALWPGIASAGALSGGDGNCKLSRSPWVPHRATPSQIECVLDEDDDGLDDSIEAEIAECFVPTLHFASGEFARVDQSSPEDVKKKFPGGQEPFTAFSLWPSSSSAQQVAGTIKVKYATLYSLDGGYYKFNPFDTLLTPQFLGQEFHNSHDGDSQGVDLRLTVQEAADGTWTARLDHVGVGIQDWDRDATGSSSGSPSCSTSPLGAFVTFNTLRIKSCSPPKQVETLALEGNTHARVIASYGKHHYYLNVVNSTWTAYAWEVRDPITGTVCDFFGFCPEAWVTAGEVIEKTTTDGAAVVPVLEIAYPAPTDPLRPTNVGSLSSSVSAELSADRAAECQKLTQFYAVACACDPGAQYACPPAPDDPGACPALAAEREAACAPLGPVPDSPPASVCLSRTLGGTPQASKFIGSIGSVYPGASFASDSKFCGFAGGTDEDCADGLLGKVSAPVPATIDSDGDGAANYTDLCPAIPPLGADHTDADVDGAGAECDPSEFRDAWVGPGFATLNARAYAGGPGFYDDPKRVGWLDTDADGNLNGADTCPSVPGSAGDNVNEWGEKTSFPGSGGGAFAAYAQTNDPLHGVYSPSEKNLGFIQRGTVCDSYEASFMQEDTTEPDEPQNDPCLLFGAYGSPQVSLFVKPVRGVSPNDPIVAADKDKPYVERLKIALEQSRPVLLDPRRCGCEQAEAKGKAHCLDRVVGECPQRFPLDGDPNAGTGWLPVERKTCTHVALEPGSDAGHLYCVPLPAVAYVPPPTNCPIGPATDCPPSNPSMQPKWSNMTWQWQTEVQTFPGHFPTGWFSPTLDINGSSYVKPKTGLRFTFATRTFLGGPGVTDTDANPIATLGFRSEAVWSVTRPIRIQT